MTPGTVLDDASFLKLTRELGFPTDTALARCLDTQTAWASESPSPPQRSASVVVVNPAAARALTASVG